MAWIDTIAFADATGRLKKHYERVGGPDGNVDNTMQVHSLRPHTLEAHMGLYKSTLHHSANTLPDWMLECIGVYVSLLNRCDYCAEHHFEGLRRLLNDGTRASALREALEGENFESAFSKREREALKYVKQLTCAPATLTNADIHRLREVGLEDGEILEINQCAAYFAYANRTVLGLGVSTEGDVLGTSPGKSGDLNEWEHT